MEPAVAVLRRRAGTIAHAIAARAPADSILVIFAGGSVARDRVWSARVDGVQEIYSDIDLYVVVRDDAHAAAVRQAAAAVVRALENDVDGVRFVRGVDAGVYTAADLRAQPIRPGTADLSAHHLVLYGDAGVLPGVLPGPVTAIDPAEALYLLENRAWDVHDRDDAGGPLGRLRRVASLKLDLDIAAAYMIAAGAPAGSVSDPAAALSGGDGVISDPHVLEAAWRAGVARENLALHLSAPAGAPSGPVRLARAWMALAPGVLGGTGPDAAGLIALRCGEGRRAGNGREFIRMARRAGVARWRALVAAPGCSARSPRAALRVHALVRVLEPAERAGAFDTHVAFAGRVASRLGFDDGTVDARVRDAHRALS